MDAFRAAAENQFLAPAISEDSASSVNLCGDSRSPQRSPNGDLKAPKHRPTKEHRAPPVRTQTTPR
jgi:hypothetical protein